METLVHEGSTFTKANVLAKKYRYTADYLGQLCRKGKVQATLVGRAWYINEDSLLSHQSVRYPNLRQNEKISNNNIFSVVVHSSDAPSIAVHPRLSKTTIRQTLQDNDALSSGKSKQFLKRIAIYEADASDLLPQTAPKTPLIPVEKAQKINISLEDKPATRLVFEDLPEVSLLGSLEVESLDEENLFTDPEPVLSLDDAMSDLDDENSTVMKVRVHRKYEPKHQTVPLHREVRPSLPIRQVSVPKPSPKVKLAVPVHSANSNISVVSFSWTRLLIVPFFIILSITSAAVLLGTSAHVEYDGFSFSQSLSFNLAAAVEVTQKTLESY